MPETPEPEVPETPVPFEPVVLNTPQGLLELTPQVALQLVHDACGQFRGTIPECDVVKAALSVLDQHIGPVPDPEPEAEPNRATRRARPPRAKASTKKQPARRKPVKKKP